MRLKRTALPSFFSLLIVILAWNSISWRPGFGTPSARLETRSFALGSPVNETMQALHRRKHPASRSQAEVGDQLDSKLRPLAFVTFLYGNAYVLPARVMLHSLRAHQRKGVLFEPPGGVAADLDDSVLEAAAHTRSRDESGKPHALLLALVTPDVSGEARAQLHRDGVYTHEVRHVRNPYIGGERFNHRFDDVLAKLQVFALEQFEKVVYVDADALVLGHIHDMFQCGDFCAAFINPCHFNSGVMVIRPSQALFQDMLRKLATTESYDGGDQGFLNVYYADLFYAPGFGPDDPHRGGQLRRLPFGYHLDHIIYYPRLRWEVPDRCGGLRIVEFMGVPLFKPWQWWTYPVMDLSWEWHAMRAQLTQPYPPNYNLGPKWVAVRFLGVYGCLYLLWLFMTNRLGLSAANRRRRAPFLSIENWLLQSRVVRSLFALDDRLYLYIMVIIGMTGWLITTIAAACCIPMLTTPYLAVAIYIHFKVLFTFVWMLLFGLICMRRHRLPDAKHARGGVLFRLLCYALADASAPPIVFGIAWHIPWSSFFAKVFGLLFCLPFYLIGLNATYAHLVLLWARQGAAMAERDRARSRSLNTAPDDPDLTAVFSDLTRESHGAVLFEDSPTTNSSLPTASGASGQNNADGTRYQLRSP